MSRFISLGLDGEGLRQFAGDQAPEGWRGLEVPLGEDVFLLDIKKTTPASHAMPAAADEVPTLDECAEVVGRLWIAVSCNPERVKLKEPRRAPR